MAGAPVPALASVFQRGWDGSARVSDCFKERLSLADLLPPPWLSAAWHAWTGHDRPMWDGCRGHARLQRCAPEGMMAAGRQKQAGRSCDLNVFLRERAQV